MDKYFQRKVMEDIKYSYVNLKPAKCAVDIGDGSERAEYVNQDYILNAIGRPHRCVDIMYTYYPNDEQWPARISEACADMEVNFQWDYPYDDYCPYGQKGEPFEQMKDIRRHGQDVLLTLTMDTKVTDDQIRKIAKDLKPYGRMYLRLNHECYGTWFTHNKRNTYQEVADFFVRASKIFRDEAPNIKMVFCAGFIEDDKTEVHHVKEFAEAYKTCDVYSCDIYMALNFGWPYDVANPGGGRYYSQSMDKTYETFKKTQRFLTEHFGSKPFILGEFNTDGDVTGGFLQPDSIARFYRRLEEEKSGHISGISLYQFRDRGRLGLECEDPNNKQNGIRQPLFYEYRKLIRDEFYSPVIDIDKDSEKGADKMFPAKMRWGGSEDARGIAIPVNLSMKEMPVFFDITCDEENSLMIEVLGRWFYKAPGVKTIDLMPVFYEAVHDLRDKDLMNMIAELGGNISISIFATPREGINDTSLTDYYDVIEHEPQIRLFYEPCGTVD